MSLTDEDKKWLATLAMIMMNHLAWLIAIGSRAQEDWADNCCFDFGGGVRMIFVVRHSKEWVNYIRGYNLISWMSDSPLPPNEEELLQSLMRRFHGNPSGGSEAKLRTQSIGPGTVG